METKVRKDTEVQELLMRLLEAEQCSCVIRNGDTVRLFRRRGVKDLFELLQQEPAFLAGACVADKIVGKGAAALMLLGGVRSLRTETLSEAALELLQTGDIELTYDTVVPHIVRRDGAGICPVEALCSDCRTAADCLPRIAGFLEQMAQKGEP